MPTAPSGPPRRNGKDVGKPWKQSGRDVGISWKLRPGGVIELTVGMVDIWVQYPRIPVNSMNFFVVTFQEMKLYHPSCSFSGRWRRFLGL
jgi:hypothetical protein